MKKLILIDGHNFLFRSFSVPFTFYSAKGTPLHVVSVFLGLLKRTLTAVGADEETTCIIAFDTETPTKNHELYKEYKANRTQDYSQMEDNPFHHLVYVKKVLQFLDLQICERAGIEADDIIASLSKSYLEQFESGKVYIASNDTDFFQIVEERIMIIKNLKHSQSIIIDGQYIYEHVGVWPQDYVLYKALVGDYSDNIKGVPSIGKIRAPKIIYKTITVDLSRYQEVIDRNSILITLDKAVPVEGHFNKSLQLKLLSLPNTKIFTQLGF